MSKTKWVAADWTVGGTITEKHVRQVYMLLQQQQGQTPRP